MSEEQFANHSTKTAVGAKKSKRVKSLDDKTAAPRKRTGKRSSIGEYPKTVEDLNELLPPPPVPRRTCKERWTNFNRALCDDWRFSTVTTILTIYALFGDDIRLGLTHKSMDPLFDTLTCVCFVVFGIEVVAASWGREGYFLGFFFVLDVVSTLTLALDLTVVGNALFCSTSVEGGDAAKTSRAGRAGARASRTVRIIRLLRLVRLYSKIRVYAEKRQAEKARLEKSRHPEEVTAPGEGAVPLPGDSADADPEEEGEEKKDKETETRVGKKLSEMTTRRVIILVLVMLVCMPQFQAPTSFGSSVDIGMSFVYDRWRSWCPWNASNASALPACLQGLPDMLSGGQQADVVERQSLLRLWYERALLQLIYTHHIGDFLYRLCWIGFKSKTMVDILQLQGLSAAQAQQQQAAYMAALAQLARPEFLGDHVFDPTGWDATFARPEWSTPAVPLQARIKDSLSKPWKENCQTFSGVTASSRLLSNRPSACSVDAELRCSEVQYYGASSLTQQEADHLSILFAFDRRDQTQMEARFSILATFFILGAVGTGSVTFAKDADHLLLNPIQAMIKKMETIKDDPLDSMTLGDREYRVEELATIKQEAVGTRKVTKLENAYEKLFKKKPSQPMETVILEKTITKLGVLLAVSFGEQGALVVGDYLTGDQTVELDILTPGHPCRAVICSCGIRNFKVIFQCLEEETVLFVNKIAEIVHGCTDDYIGAPNQSLGSGFIVIWRLDEREPRDALKDKKKTKKWIKKKHLRKGKQLLGEHGPSEEEVARKRQQDIADMAVLAMVRIVVKTTASISLLGYRGHPKINDFVPSFQPEVQIGMHTAEVTECAIGSDHKLDALYLVNSMKLPTLIQECSKNYQAPLLLSSAMVSTLSQPMAMLCRLVDHVHFAGFVKNHPPVRLFSLDLDPSKLQPGADLPKTERKVIKNRFKLRQIRDIEKAERKSLDYSAFAELMAEPLVQQMRSDYTYDFFLRFATAYRNYEAGQWQAARDMLLTCHYDPKQFIADHYSPLRPDEWPVDGPIVGVGSCFCEDIEWADRRSA
eukprot:TRINITY_DN10295_c0_g1_i4.p1 TRINITY_DN10295_c0_g1~~TRINITY_DN10295_c0_g1_i4.p1  ORF type:complete len:1045 (+),score=162.02 TRINITY_DN10295_c0_g1_i4:117-3251(+)